MRPEDAAREERFNLEFVKDEERATGWEWRFNLELAKGMEGEKRGVRCVRGRGCSRIQG